MASFLCSFLLFYFDKFHVSQVGAGDQVTGHLATVPDKADLELIIEEGILPDPV